VKPDKKPASLEELLHSQMVALDALVRILERKGVLTQSDLLAEIVEIKRELSERTKRN
jgi:hypothetical protein